MLSAPCRTRYWPLVEVGGKRGLAVHAQSICKQALQTKSAGSDNGTGRFFRIGVSGRFSDQAVTFSCTPARVVTGLGDPAGSFVTAALISVACIPLGPWMISKLTG